MATEKLCLLGSTGSIGTQTLEVCSELGIKVNGISCNRNWKKAEEQIRRFSPDYVCVTDEEAARELKTRISDTGCELIAGTGGLVDLVHETDCDTVLNSLVGMVGLIPTLAALDCGKDVALANKETLVAGGKLVTDKVKETGKKLLPVDSEHSAIFQCLLAAQGNELTRIHLTASGGPFRTWEKERVASATAADALKHPNWNMGAKITIDSATMVNKGFEVIEARWLFDVGPDRINVVVHPESVVHSMVEFADGAVIAQMGCPDMRQPIQFALAFPQRLSLNNRKLDFAGTGALTFSAPDTDRFPGLALAYKAIGRGGNISCAMNAADEVAVAAFLRGGIGFYDISDVISSVMDGTSFVGEPSLDDIFSTDRDAAARALEAVAAIERRRN